MRAFTTLVVVAAVAALVAAEPAVRKGEQQAFFGNLFGGDSDAKFQQGMNQLNQNMNKLSQNVNQFQQGIGQAHGQVGQLTGAFNQISNSFNQMGQQIGQQTGVNVPDLGAITNKVNGFASNLQNQMVNVHGAVQQQHQNLQNQVQQGQQQVNQYRQRGQQMVNQGRQMANQFKTETNALANQGKALVNQYKANPFSNQTASSFSNFFNNARTTGQSFMQRSRSFLSGFGSLFGGR